MTNRELVREGSGALGWRRGLCEIDAEHLVYESVKPGAGGSVSLMRTPLELIERLATLDSHTAPAGC
jgi:hypothetical protein